MDCFSWCSASISCWCTAGSPRFDLIREGYRLFPLLRAGLMPATPSALEQARDRQDRPALEKFLNEYTDAANKAPNDADAQYRAAVAASYLAGVGIEMHER